mmetsp:Transcript_14573/g.50310  ORF Transcript_14573/g.50310 Transcript_14573/m.50310 type:complete len:267 (-) Transcript_14573:355-1155(-)
MVWPLPMDATTSPSKLKADPAPPQPLMSPKFFVESLPQTTWIDARHEPSLSSTKAVAPFSASRTDRTQPMTVTDVPMAASPLASSSLRRTRPRENDAGYIDAGSTALAGPADFFFAGAGAGALAAFLGSTAASDALALGSTDANAGTCKHVAYQRSTLLCLAASVGTSTSLASTAACTRHTNAQSATETRSPARNVAFFSAPSNAANAAAASFFARAARALFDAWAATATTATSSSCVPNSSHWSHRPSSKHVLPASSATGESCAT